MPEILIVFPSFALPPCLSHLLSLQIYKAGESLHDIRLEMYDDVVFDVTVTVSFSLHSVGCGDFFFNYRVTVFRKGVFNLFFTSFSHEKSHMTWHMSSMMRLLSMKNAALASSV